MLGLEYGAVRLELSSDEWNSAFREEHELLSQSLHRFQWKIEHIGSTAVPGLIAKPILDICIGIPAGERVEPCIPRIVEIGYTYRGDAGISGGHLFVKEVRDLVRTHHVHVVNVDDPQWDSYLQLRDYLRHDQAARDIYAKEKQALARRYPTNRRAYAQSKDELVARLLADGKEWQRTTGR